MGRPKHGQHITARIDKGLWSFIREYSKKNELNNYRKASEEIAKWLEELEIKARKGRL